MIYITLFPAEIGLSFSVTSNTKQTANWLERGATGDPAHLDHDQDPTRARSPAAPLIPHPVDDYVADPPQTVVDSTGTVVGEVLKIEGVGMSAASIKYPLAGGEYVVLSVSGGSIGTIGSSHNREAPQGCLTLLTSAARRRPPLEKMECGTLLAAAQAGRSLLRPPVPGMRQHLLPHSERSSGHTFDRGGWDPSSGKFLRLLIEGAERPLGVEDDDSDGQPSERGWCRPSLIRTT